MFVVRMYFFVALTELLMQVRQLIVESFCNLFKSIQTYFRKIINKLHMNSDTFAAIDEELTTADLAQTCKHTCESNCNCACPTQLCKQVSDNCLNNVISQENRPIASIGDSEQSDNSQANPSNSGQVLVGQEIELIPSNISTTNSETVPLNELAIFHPDYNSSVDQAMLDNKLSVLNLVSPTSDNSLANANEFNDKCLLFNFEPFQNENSIQQANNAISPEEINQQPTEPNFNKPGRKVSKSKKQRARKSKNIKAAPKVIGSTTVKTKTTAQVNSKRNNAIVNNNPKPITDKQRLAPIRRDGTINPEVFFTGKSQPEIDEIMAKIRNPNIVEMTFLEDRKLSNISGSTEQYKMDFPTIDEAIQILERNKKINNK